MCSRLAAILAFTLLACSLSFGQAVGNPTGYETPDLTITGGIHFDQAATPQIQGDVDVAKHVSSGVYQYNDVKLTSIRFIPVQGQKIPQVEVQTQTETGACGYIATVAGFALSTCVAGGLAAAPGQSGPSGSGNLVGLKRTGWKDSVWGFNAGPSYSGVSGGVSWLFGVRFGWAK